MKRLLACLMFICLVAVVPAQQRKSAAGQKRTATTHQRAPQKKQKTGKSSVSGKSVKPAKSSKPTPSVKGLQAEQKKIKENIKEQERRLKANEQDVKKRLQNLMAINNEIADKQRTIDTIRTDITRLEGDIHVLESQLIMLQKELEQRKLRYQKSMRYMHRNRNLQSKLLFVFSGRNFSQIYRRIRFVRDYAAYQQAQGEAVMEMQQEVTEAFNELKDTKQLKNTLLHRGEQEQRSLETKQTEQQNMVTSLRKEQKTIQGIIDQQKKRDAELNARIDKLIAEEIERARKRAEAEAKKKAAEEEAARKRAEQAAEAKRKAAEEAANKGNAAKNTTTTTGKGTTTTGKSSAARGKAGKNGRGRETVSTTRKTTAPARSTAVSAEDRRLSGSFESNKGRLPMPIVGSYKLIHHFGANAVTDVKGNMWLDVRGIDLKAQPRAQVRSIFAGEVTAVFYYYDSTVVVIIRHGNYLSVYCNLASVNVSRGQKVTARQTIGSLGPDGMIQFQLRKGDTKLDPMKWLSH